MAISTTESSVIYLPNPIFNCTATDAQFQCQADVQNQTLNVTLLKGSDYPYNPNVCRAEYGNQLVSCKDTGMNYAPILATMYELTGLPLTTEQLQAIERQYWGINTIKKWGEIRLLWIVMGLALAAGVIFGLFAWLHPGGISKGFVSVACGFGTYQMVWSVLGRLPYYDAVTSHGLTLDTWHRVLHGGAIAVGIITILTTALFLWERLNPIGAVLAGILSVLGMFQLCWSSLRWTFVHLPPFFSLSTSSSHVGYVLMWVSMAIATIFAIFTAVQLWQHSRQSLQWFRCLSGSFGGVAIAANVLMALLLGLGYID
ncbi:MULTISPECIES: hypothetical protein [unclassified Leptolyngbya]|uniref:hypothetical protein n=1 Tax=unclassified Leptolyngbya TaxID=2650499 RepID=UPI0016872E04|nr:MULTISPECIES: hypothetical protein [unclassified Leptolyngbya]MBD1911468.1 hypothetical protein [Leptolyngbya sp. FACHB-8]MBD2156398.1 hypothetical protein [Leptolyngbya sp. FACHB-16]